MAVHETVPQVLKTETFPPELVYNTTIVIHVAVVYRHAVNVSAATINQSREVTSFHQIVHVSIQSCGNRLNTYAFLDSGSTVSCIDQSVQEKSRAQGADVTTQLA